MSSYVAFQLGLHCLQKSQKDLDKCCVAHRGLPVGFLLLRYSVVVTVESYSLLYLLVIS